MMELFRSNLTFLLSGGAIFFSLSCVSANASIIDNFTPIVSSVSGVVSGFTAGPVFTGTFVPPAVLTDLYATEIAQMLAGSGTTEPSSVTDKDVAAEAPGPLSRTPEPAAMLLFGSGFVGLGLIRRDAARS